MRLVEDVLTLILVIAVFVVVYLNSYSPMDNEISYNPSFPVEKRAGIIDELNRHDRVLLPPNKVKWVHGKLFAKTDLYEKKIQQDE